jgi:hypothetical protein
MLFNFYIGQLSRKIQPVIRNGEDCPVLPFIFAPIPYSRRVIFFCNANPSIAGYFPHHVGAAALQRYR